MHPKEKQKREFISSTIDQLKKWHSESEASSEDELRMIYIRFVVTSRSFNMEKLHIFTLFDVHGQMYEDYDCSDLIVWLKKSLKFFHRYIPLEKMVRNYWARDLLLLKAEASCYQNQYYLSKYNSSAYRNLKKIDKKNNTKILEEIMSESTTFLGKPRKRRFRVDEMTMDEIQPFLDVVGSFESRKEAYEQARHAYDKLIALGRIDEALPDKNKLIPKSKKFNFDIPTPSTLGKKELKEVLLMRLKERELNK